MSLFALAAFWLGSIPETSRAGFTEAAAAYGVADGDSMSYAAGFVDYDGDGDPDLFVSNHWKGPADFFRNEAGAAFLETSSHYGTGNSDRHDQLWADFDNDGDPDQYIIHSREQDNELYWNLGCDLFLEGASAAGIAETDGRGREITIADFDGNGYVDIFLVNGLRSGFLKPNRLFWNNGDGTFTAQPNVELLFESRLHVSSADYDLDGDPDLVLTNPPFVSGEFYRNEGDSTFRDITSAAFPGISLPLGEAQGLTWSDYDNDGDLDLLASGGNRGVWDFAALEGDSVRFYVECDSAEYKTLEFVTDGDSVTVSAVRSDWGALDMYYGGLGDSVSSFPVTVGLAQLDGQPPAISAGGQALFLWRVQGAGADTVRLMGGGPGAEPLLVGGALRENGTGITSFVATGLDSPPPYSTHDWSNRLFRNRGDGTFEEVTATAFPVNDPTFNTKGAAWGDYDNDGWADVYMANGGTVNTGNQANYLFRNNGDGTFTEVAAAEGVQGSAVGMSDGAAWGDVNGDGSLDLFVDNGAEHPPFGVGPRQLFLNTPNGNHWIRIQLRGLTSNGSAIGARVRFLGPGGERWRWRLGESDDCFSNDHAIHCGLGTDTVLDTVQVFWPSGQVDSFDFVAVDQSYFAVEGKPLRIMQNPHFLLLNDTVTDTLDKGAVQKYSIAVDNFGGLASHYSVVYEDCAGAPITWLSISPESTTVWPGGTTPLSLTVSTGALPFGSYCGRVIFLSNSFMGPDTLTVNLQVNDPAVSAELPSGLPDRFGLGSPRPNPTSGGAVLVLALPAAADVEVVAFDVAGRRVSTLFAGRRERGYHEVTWDGRDSGGRRVAPGIYLVRARAGHERAVRKIVRLD